MRSACAAASSAGRSRVFPAAAESRVNIATAGRATGSPGSCPRVRLPGDAHRARRRRGAAAAAAAFHSRAPSSIAMIAA